MFQFSGSPPVWLWIHHTVTVHDYSRVSPFGNLRVKTDVCSSPQLIAAYRVLLRLLMPWHSPYALVRLTFCVFSYPCSFLTSRLFKTLLLSHVFSLHLLFCFHGSLVSFCNQPLVEMRRIELLTSCLQGRRSPI